MGLSSTAQLRPDTRTGGSFAPIENVELPPAVHAERDPRFDHRKVKESVLAQTPSELDRPTEARRAAGLPLHESFGVTFSNGTSHHNLWRISPIREPSGRGELFRVRWNHRSNAKMSLSQRRVYLNQNYYQAAGELRAPRDSQYQFSVMMGVRDDTFGHASRIDVKVTADEVHLLQHVNLQFDPGTSPRQRNEFKNRVAEAVSEILDAKLDIIEMRDGAPIRRKLRFNVNISANAKGNASDEDVVKVIAGSGRADAGTLYLSSSKGTIAHEFCHRMLAAEDEYSDLESLKKAPERKVNEFDLDEEHLGGKSRLMDDSQNGRLFPTHALAIASVLQRALSSTAETAKFLVAFAPDQVPHKLTSPEALQVKKRERLTEQGIRLLEDKLTDAGWVYQETSGHFMRDPVTFRRILPRFIAIQDAFKEFPENQSARGLGFSSSGYEFVGFLAERIGYDRFRSIVVPPGDARFFNGAFEATVMRSLSEALGNPETTKGQALERRFGSKAALVREILVVLDSSASKALEHFVDVYGESPETIKATEVIEQAENEEAAYFRSAIRGLTGG